MRAAVLLGKIAQQNVWFQQHLSCGRVSELHQATPQWQWSGQWWVCSGTCAALQQQQPHAWMLVAAVACCCMPAAVVLRKVAQQNVWFQQRLSCSKVSELATSGYPAVAVVRSVVGLLRDLRGIAAATATRR
jgi:hypothetical protein